MNGLAKRLLKRLYKRLDAKEKPKEYETTREVKVKDSFDAIVGQERAKRVLLLALLQKRHVLLVGPPGVGKSLLAKSIVEPQDNKRNEMFRDGVLVFDNPTRPEKPKIKVVTEEEEWKKETKTRKSNEFLKPFWEVNPEILKALGIMCRRCGEISSVKKSVCPRCGAPKFAGEDPFSDLYREKPKPYVDVYEVENGEKVKLRYFPDPKDEPHFIRVIKLTKRKSKKFKVLIDPWRPIFVRVAGNNAAELLGDVEHDPYGGHPKIGIPLYKRIIAGAIHEAHKGVLYIDEFAAFSPSLQRKILTAMQDKQYPISGHNPNSSGAYVRTEPVPCDFILIGATNLVDLANIHPAIRSRIRGEGYEVLMDTVVEDNEVNRWKFAKFVAWEVKKDGKIPHFTREAVEELINIAKRIAKIVDEEEGITLRLRGIAGLIKAAGDLAKIEGAELVEREHIRKAKSIGKSVEEQLQSKGRDWWKSLKMDYEIEGKKWADVR
jgi:predicted ATP-dependent protease